MFYKGVIHPEAVFGKWVFLKKFHTYSGSVWRFKRGEAHNSVSIALG
ncbi:hypothetical protein [Pedobacter sp. MR2016-24]|nr:hypothetical protein [Pedobacter sp. MR2016-24]